MDWRADLASLLLLMHEIATGVRPFDRLRAPVIDVHDDTSDMCPLQSLLCISRLLLGTTPGKDLFWNRRYRGGFAEAAPCVASGSAKLVLRVPRRILPPRTPVA